MYLQTSTSRCKDGRGRRLHTRDCAHALPGIPSADSAQTCDRNNAGVHPGPRLRGGAPAISGLLCLCPGLPYPHDCHGWLCGTPSHTLISHNHAVPQHMAHVMRACCWTGNTTSCNTLATLSVVCNTLATLSVVAVICQYATRIYR